MKKKVIKLLIIGLILINIILINNFKSYAMSDVTENPGAFQPNIENKVEDQQEYDDWQREYFGGEDVGGKHISLSTVSQQIAEKAGVIISVIRVIGIVISVATLSVIGIKFMLGSVEEKAQYKQTLLPWMIGAIMIFAITTIPSLIFQVTKSAI